MKKLTKWLLLVLLILTFIVWAPIVKSPTIQSVQVVFMDVGQGDAVLIEKGNYQILIDGGPDESILEQLGKHMPLLDRKIELAILTHPHADHLTGLNLVLERYEVERVVSTGIEYESNTYKKFVSLIERLDKENKTDLIVPKVGQSLSLFEGAEMEFLWPPEQYDSTNINNSSIVSRFCYIEKCLFLPGDLETDALENLVLLSRQNKYEISSELIKLPHHGSSNGTNQHLIEAIKPKIVVISVGIKNKFNHPHDSVLKIIDSYKLPLFKTSDGSQIFIFDAQGVVKVD